MIPKSMPSRTRGWIPVFGNDHAPRIRNRRTQSSCLGFQALWPCVMSSAPAAKPEARMFPKPKAALTPNTYAYESEPLVKATGFREYDARRLFQKEINLMGVQALGMGLGTLIRQMGVEPRVVTGHDFRSYSASIKMALTNG